MKSKFLLLYSSQGGMMDYFNQEFLNNLGQKADISKIQRVR